MELEKLDLSKDYNAQAEDELQEPLFALRDEIVNSSKRDKARFLRAADELRGAALDGRGREGLAGPRADVGRGGGHRSPSRCSPAAARAYRGSLLCVDRSARPAGFTPHEREAWAFLN